MMQSIITSDKFCRKYKDLQHDLHYVTDWLIIKNEPLLEYDYPLLHDHDHDQQQHQQHQQQEKNDPQQQIFEQQLNGQQQKFMQKAGFTPEQYQIVKRAFNVLSMECAKVGNYDCIHVAWEKMKEAGIIPSREAMNTYLYLTGTMSSSFSSSSMTRNRYEPSSFSNNNNNLSAVMNILGDPNDDDETNHGNDSNKASSSLSSSRAKQKNIDIPTEMAIFHDLLFEPTEKSISLRVKKLVSQGHAKDAEYLLDSFPSHDDARLRTFLPIVKLYCEQGDITSALRLFTRMRDEPTVTLEPENYVLLLSSMMENGCFR